jgi:hypothetical protein
MIKKSLIVASLLLAGTSAVASDYIEFGYSTGTTTLSNSNGSIDSTGYSIGFTRNTNDYIIGGSIAKSKMDSSRITLGGVDYSYDNNIVSFGFGGGYKILKKDNIFAGPYAIYSSWNGDCTPFTKISTGQKYTTDENSDTDLEIGLTIGYTLNNDVDSYIYVDYSLDDDILESKDHDDHNLEIGIEYKINKKIILQASYSKDMLNDEGISSYSDISLGMGYIF